MELTQDMVTPEAVLEAYKATGLKPVFKNWGNGIDCGCAMTALVKHHHPDALQQGWGNHGGMVEAITEITGLTSTFVHSFVNGFDCVTGLGHDAEYFELGKQVREAVLAYVQKEGGGV